jgi:hypothetical protein
MKQVTNQMVGMCGSELHPARFCLVLNTSFKIKNLIKSQIPQYHLPFLHFVVEQRYTFMRGRTHQSTGGGGAVPIKIQTLMNKSRKAIC